jgi:predicted  nucleic acid-binding Zn-ribbon protein
MDNLQSLKELEKLDIEIARLEKSKKSLPMELSDYESRLDEKKKSWDESKKKLENLSLERDHILHRIEENKAALEKSNEKLSQVTREREYDAVLKELRDRKRIIDRENKQLQKTLSQISEEEDRESERKEAYETLWAELNPQIKDHTTQLGSIDSDIAEVRAQRPKLEDKIDRKFLTVYRRIQKSRKNGRALSHINMESTYCTYCYQVITPKIAHLAKSASYPVLCENCGSIFVVE